MFGVEVDEPTSHRPPEFDEALPDYTIGAELGRGMFGVVWAARHRHLERDVAVKQFTGPLATEREYATRFQREARLLAQLDHSHVVTVYDYREFGDLRLLVMERLGGGTFADRSGGMGMESILASAMAAASALHHVHEHGILHRDVKPENLMFDGRGTLKVTDFGLARGDVASVTAVDLSHAGQFFGTPAYTAPEQAAELLGDDWPEASEASDQYALAAVVYEALTGELTHDATGGRIALLNRRMHEPARPLRAATPDVPESVETVVMRALRTDPRDRYADVETFAVALGGAATSALGSGWLERSEVRIRESGPIGDSAGAKGVAGVVVPPPPVGPSAAPLPAGAPDARASGGDDPAGSRTRRNALVAIVVGLVLALGGGLAWFLTRDDGSAPTATPESGADGATTEAAWTVETDDQIVGGAVASGTDVVFAGTDGTVRAVAASDGAQRWEFETGGAVAGTPAVADGSVFVGSSDGKFYAIDAADGTERWSSTLGFTITSSPVVASGRVIVGADELHAFDAASGGDPVWTYETGDPVVSSPAVEGDVVVVGSNDGRIHGVSLTSGTGLWTVTSGDPVLASPTIVDGTAYVGSAGGRFYAIDVATGDVEWQIDLGAEVKSSAAVSDGAVFVGTDGGELLAVEAADGTIRWRSDLGDAVQSSPVVSGSRVVVGANSGKVTALALDDGSVVGSFDTGGFVIARPLIVDDLVVVGSADGRLYAIDGLVTS